MDGGPLNSVGLAPGSREAADGLVKLRATGEGLPPDEQAFVWSAREFEAVDYVFFRRFNDGRSSQPAAFVIDNTKERLSEADLAATHRELWLHGIVPLLYIARPTRIDILSCARGADFWADGELCYSPAFQLETASGIQASLEQRRFSARRLADGTFWEDPANQPLADHEKAAHESLIREVVEADKELNGEANPVARRLLLLSVLVKYLEDRGVFPSPTWFGRFRTGARSFYDVLEGADPDEVSRLLAFLEQKFNGDVFCLPGGGRPTKKVLREIARVVEARTRDDQRYFWELYSFEHLPVEVISHLYERFVQDSTAVYTPPFLAALLLDHAMPYGELTGKERVLDPACGSGVFLVGAFRRLVNAWRAKNSWRTPDADTLKAILKNGVFGSDLDSDAIDLTAFSLALAVCDCLRPDVIWKELRFDRLRGSNLRRSDFFDLCESQEADTPWTEGFDVIVGNPPIKSKLTKAAKRVGSARAAERGHIPDKQIAYLFLEQAVEMLQPGGRLCLIQPSGFLYNLKSHGFRSALAKTGRIQAVLDFTSVRGLYEGADPKTVAVLAGDTSEAAGFLHLTFRRTYKTAECIAFELDHYDRHVLRVDDVALDPRAARANLLGGGRLAAMASRLRGMRTLSAYVEERDWVMGEGFIIGPGGRQAKHLKGQNLLPTEALTDDGIERERLETVTATSFYRPGRAELFESPVILIREHESLPVDYWDDGVLTFKDSIVGIRAPRSEDREHKTCFERLKRNHRFYRFAVLLNGSRALVRKATAVSKDDIGSLPYPEDESELDLTFWEEALVDDTLEYLADYVRLGQKAELLKRAADEQAMTEYASLYCRLLGSLYDNLRPAEPVFLDGLTCQPFFFGDEPAIEWLGPDCEEQLTKLVFEQTLPSLRTVRVVRFYHENVVFIVKPDRLRYWIRSTAIRDADDTLFELRQQGY